MTDFNPLFDRHVCLYDYEVTGTDKASIDTGVDDGGNGALALPTNYRVLEHWIYARTDEVTAGSPLNMTVNNDTSSIYDRVVVVNNNATVSGANVLAGAAWTRNVAGASLASGVFGLWRLSIPNYGRTVGNKFAEMTTGILDTTAANTAVAAVLLGYRSTNALSRFKIAPGTGGVKLKVGSRWIIVAY